MAARQNSFRGDHASDEVFDFECGPCQFDGKILEANGFCSDCSEYLCDLCFKTHLKPMPCRHHILLDASKMPKDKSAVKTVDVSTVRCKKHAANVIEYYCSIHEYLGCSTCMTLEHRACEGVGFIPSIVEGLYETQEYVDYKQSINAVDKSTKDNEHKINRNTTEAERLYNTTKQEIKECRMKINSFIDSLENKIDTQLSNLNDHRIKLLKEATDSNKSLGKEIKDVSAEITKGEKQVKRINSFILMKRTKGNIKQYTKKADEILDKSNANEYSFRNEFEKCKPLLDGLFGSIVEEGKIKPKPSTQFSKAPPMDLPNFIHHPQGIVLNDRVQALVECEVLDNSEMTWYKGNDVIQESYDFKFSKAGNVYQLLIAEVFLEDSGVYHAEASSATGTTSSYFNIHVIVPDEEPIGPVFKQFPNSVTVDEGYPVKFTCSLDSADTVNWLKGSRLLDESDRVQVTTTGNTSMLEIPTVIATDAGVYNVEATNQRGNSLCTFTLAVNISASPCADIDVVSLIKSLQ